MYCCVIREWKRRHTEREVAELINLKGEIDLFTDLLQQQRGEFKWKITKRRKRKQKNKYVMCILTKK
jgi:hypothetical protein